MKRIIGVAAAVLLLAGCSDQGPTMTPGSPAPAEVTPAATAAAPSLVGKVGDTYVGNRIDATVEEFNPRVTTTASDQTWQAAPVKTCVKADGIVLTSPWQAIGADSGRYRNTGGYYGDAPKPLYPIGDDSVLTGECVRGWILFDSPANVEVGGLRYSTQGRWPGALDALTLPDLSNVRMP